MGLLSEITCCRCGTKFSVADEYKQMLLRSGETFYCPAGHPQHFDKRENEEIVRLRNLYLTSEKTVSVLKDDLSHARGQAKLNKRRQASLKGQITRLRKEIARLKGEDDA